MRFDQTWLKVLLYQVEIFLILIALRKNDDRTIERRLQDIYQEIKIERKEKKTKQFDSDTFWIQLSALSWVFDGDDCGF